MKAIVLLFVLNAVFISLSFAEECKVSGISDSPQSISCHYRDGWSHKMELNIRCLNGTYAFAETANGSPAGEGKITIAYHEEVTSGASPLVFKMDDSRSLRITKSLGLFYRGEFINDGNPGSRNGRFSCSLK